MNTHEYFHMPEFFIWTYIADGAMYIDIFWPYIDPIHS